MRNPNSSLLPYLAPALLLLLCPLLASGDESKGPAATEDSRASSHQEDDPFPGVTKKDLEGTPSRGKKEEQADAFKEALARIAEPSVDGALLDAGIVRKLIDQVQPAIVKVTHQSRDGHTLGTGSGFLISKDGLIATNQHVIGTARPIRVALFDGTEFDVTEVHAWDRRLDLAILRIEKGDREFPFLPIAGPESIEQGQPILGFGNPQGLEFSVVSGLISAIRELDEELQLEGELPDFPMIQVAMPIEMGNSGGPIINLDGEVLGIVTIKHVATPNLGFAVPSEHLGSLLEKPNTVPMHRWLTFGALDPDIWKTAMGARWTQRGGIIKAEGLGDGFGGRALCLSERAVPGQPYEISVNVRLDDESGAAGLAFASDGEDRHYGFYPSGGRIRFTRFEGPDINSWTILQQIETAAYRPGEWNEIRIRIEEETISGFVNGTEIFSMSEGVLRGGRFGLCKFRNTVAEFRHFRSGDDLGDPEVSEETLTTLTEEIDGFAADGRTHTARLDALAASPLASRQLLLDRADELEAKAEAMRRLTGDLHLREVAADLSQELDQKKPNLFKAGLHIARLDRPDLDSEYYLEQFERLVSEARTAVKGKKLDDRDRALRLAKFLFQESGFHGSRTEYYHPGNSYLNEVLEYREGLPITLSVLYLEVARQLGIKGAEGLPIPGHFMVGHRDTDAEPELVFIDVFEGGEVIARRDAENIAWSITRRFPGDQDFSGATESQIIVRMLRNLVGIEMGERRPMEARPYIDLILAVAPEESQERFQRALLRYQDEDVEGAKEDFDWLLQRRPPGLDYDRLQYFRDQLEGE